MQSENPALAALQVLAGSYEGAQERLGVRLGIQKRETFFYVEDVVPIVDGLGTGK